MANDDTLMAYIVPRLTSGVEDAATEALAYILNKSGGAMSALNELLQEGGFGIESIARVQTQVTYKDGSRPDMAGYDRHGVKRLLVESKFWAALMERQASGYASQFDEGGQAVLMFICPEARRQPLWAEIERQMDEQGRLEDIDSPMGVQRAEVVWTEPSDSQLHLMIVSWVRLLDRMDAQADDDGVKSDIRQLRGLAQRQDDEAFLPLHSEELGPDLGRRIVGYNRLVDNAVDSKGVPGKWMSVKGLSATSQRWGYGRYFHFSGVDLSFWFGVNHNLWARSGRHPFVAGNLLRCQQLGKDGQGRWRIESTGRGRR